MREQAVEVPVLVGSKATPRYGAAALGVAAFVAMMIVGAQVRILLPWSPVPFTLQTLFLHLAGATLGSGLGAASQAAYLALGACGLPVLAGGAGGAGVFAGPTGGYLLGFLVAPIVTGWMIRRQTTNGFWWVALSMSCGSILVYACGAAWLAWSLHLAPRQAFLQGVVPFIAGDLLKTAAAAGLFRRYAGRGGTIF